MAVIAGANMTTVYLSACNYSKIVKNKEWDRDVMSYKFKVVGIFISLIQGLISSVIDIIFIL